MAKFKVRFRPDLVTKSHRVSDQEAWTLLMVSIAAKAFEDFVTVMKFLDNDTEVSQNAEDPDICFDGTREGAQKAAEEILWYADSGIFPLADGSSLFRRYYLRNKQGM